jgi:hypothetical protein
MKRTHLLGIVRRRSAVIVAVAGLAAGLSLSSPPVSAAIAVPGQARRGQPQRGVLAGQQPWHRMRRDGQRQAH